MKKKDVEIVENIISQPMEEIMSDRYATYAKYVIQDRAIPDVRDGLKPVQRRIIYAMANSGMFFDKPTKKCAKIVGDVMGNYHPHGDSSIYDALTRLSQNWKMNQPLIYFQGNNGSIDDDPAAASRYTEAKLSEISEFLIKDLDKNIVENTLTYDDSRTEPLVLPARFPNLFVNGSEGIAVAIATNIPPHNLGELCLASIFRINNPNCELNDLLQIVKGPDFPTGGTIFGKEGLEEMYATGRGKFEISGEVKIENYSDHNDIIISEIPYGVNKKDLVVSIDKIRKDHEVDGIIDVKDLSSGDSINIVIELKKDINPNVVLQYLLNKTRLKISYSANIVAICDKHPKTLGLIDYLDTYIQFLKQINIKQYEYDYQKTCARLHILDGLIRSVDIIDQIIKIIRSSKDKEESKNKLVKTFDFSEIQAEAILNTRLYKLSNTDVSIYINEQKELSDFKLFCESVLNNEHVLNKVIIKDLKEIIKNVPSVRKTKISEQSQEIEITKRDLIAKEDVWVSLTRDGYIKRSSLKSYKTSNSLIPGIKEGDSLVLNKICSTLDYILGFTNLGNYVFIPVHEIVENKWKEEGKHLNYLINIPLNEYLIKAIHVQTFDKDISICIASKKGQIKKTSLKEFLVTRYSKPISCMKLMNGDEVADVTVLNNNSNILILTSNGACSLFNENEISQTGIKSGGVKSISRLNDNYVSNIISFRNSETEKILLITNKGNYRVIDPRKIELTQRLGAQSRLFKVMKSEPHELLFATKLFDRKNELNLFMVLKNNRLIEQKIDDFSLTPIDKRCKTNLENFKEDMEIKAIYNFDVNVINDETVVEEKKNLNNDEEESVSEQLSLFDE